jgi:hypothetical protein
VCARWTRLNRRRRPGKSRERCGCSPRGCCRRRTARGRRRRRRGRRTRAVAVASVRRGRRPCRQFWCSGSVLRPAIYGGDLNETADALAKLLAAWFKASSGRGGGRAPDHGERRLLPDLHPLPWLPRTYPCQARRGSASRQGGRPAGVDPGCPSPMC